MDSLEGFSPQDTSGFIAIQGMTKALSSAMAKKKTNRGGQLSASKNSVCRSRRMVSHSPSDCAISGARYLDMKTSDIICAYAQDVGSRNPEYKPRKATRIGWRSPAANTSMC